MNKTTITTQARIAKPILEVISSPNIEITDISNEGEYNFSIRNYDEKNNITEVDLKYIITIKDTIDKNLKDTVKFELYKNGKRVELNNQSSKIMEMKNSKKQEDKYKLKVKYDKNESTVMGDILDNVQIQVHSEQKRDS